MEGCAAMLKKTMQLMSAGLALSIAGIVDAPVPPAAAIDPVQVDIAAAAKVREGKSFVARVNIGDVADTDVAQYDVVYDPAVLVVIDVRGGVLDSTTMPVSAWAFVPSGTQGKIRVIQNVEGVPGVTGSGYLAEIHFQAVGNAGSSSSIDLDNGLLGDKNAQEIPAMWSGRVVQVSDTTIPGDVDGNGSVDLVDLMLVAAALNTSPPSNPDADVNGDGLVNIMDMVVVGINYGA